MSKYTKTGTKEDKRAREMAKRKSKRKSTGKGNKAAKVEKEYDILTMEEQQARDAKYAMRLADLRTCLSFIDGKWDGLQVMGYEK